ncbi:hypothetical protein GCM10022254_59270 [Actinomadura meridiana]|uniref:Uncharacterized protein n=1 Tax=Actinomadura meridiana TaxID=559626 RepID=A0ABP8CHP5_9ACTN
MVACTSRGTVAYSHFFMRLTLAMAPHASRWNPPVRIAFHTGFLSPTHGSRVFGTEHDAAKQIRQGSALLRVQFAKQPLRGRDFRLLFGARVLSSCLGTAAVPGVRRLAMPTRQPTPRLDAPEPAR